MAIAEQYLTVHIKKLASRDFNSRNSACASRTEVRDTNASSAMTEDIKCSKFQVHLILFLVFRPG